MKPAASHRPGAAVLARLLAPWLNRAMAIEREGPMAGPIFRALSDPTRRAIIAHLQGEDMAAGEIAAHFVISGPSVSRHLGLLQSAGLVRGRRQGNRLIYSLQPEPLAACLADLISSVCPGLIEAPSSHRAVPGLIAIDDVLSPPSGETSAKGTPVKATSGKRATGKAAMGRKASAKAAAKAAGAKGSLSKGAKDGPKAGAPR
jgi:DNA-binding transcriptional ArsR family regulator